MTFPKRPNVADSTPATEAFREAGVAFEGGTTAAFELWSRLTNEMMQFAADRMCESVKTQQQMLQCRNIAELAHLRAHWWQKAIDQYTEEAGRVAGIWGDALDRTIRIRAA